MVSFLHIVSYIFPLYIHYFILFYHFRYFYQVIYLKYKVDSSCRIHFIFPVQAQKQAKIFLLKILLLLLFFYPFSFALLYIPIQSILLFFCLSILFEHIHPSLYLRQTFSARILSLILACKHIYILHVCARNTHVQKLLYYIVGQQILVTTNSTLLYLKKLKTAAESRLKITLLSLLRHLIIIMSETDY